MTHLSKVSSNFCDSLVKSFFRYKFLWLTCQKFLQIQIFVTHLSKVSSDTNFCDSLVKSFFRYKFLWLTCQKFLQIQIFVTHLSKVSSDTNFCDSLVKSFFRYKFLWLTCQKFLQIQIFVTHLSKVSSDTNFCDSLVKSFFSTNFCDSLVKSFFRYKVLELTCQRFHPEPRSRSKQPRCVSFPHACWCTHSSTALHSLQRRSVQDVVFLPSHTIKVQLQHHALQCLAQCLHLHLHHVLAMRSARLRFLRRQKLCSNWENPTLKQIWLVQNIRIFPKSDVNKFTGSCGRILYVTLQDYHIARWRNNVLDLEKKVARWKKSYKLENPCRLKITEPLEKMIPCASMLLSL